MNQLVTKLFVEQPLASPGSAKKIDKQEPMTHFTVTSEAYALCNFDPLCMTN